MNAYIHSLIPTLVPYEIFDYYDEPLFYSCRDTLGHLMLIYWIDQNETSNSWLYLKISDDRYSALKNGHITVRSALSNPEEGIAYKVQVQTKTNFSVEDLPISSILPEWLPDPGEKLNIPAATLPEKTTSAVELSKKTNRQVLDIAFEQINHSYEVGCADLGKILQAIQNSLSAFSIDQKATARRITEETKSQTEFNVSGLFASSFGVRLQSKNSDLFSDDKIANATEALAQLLTYSAESETIVTELKKHHILARSHFKHLVKVLVDSNFSIKTDWGSPTGKSIRSSTSLKQLSVTLNALELSDETKPHTVIRKGKLVGIDIESDFFALNIDNSIIKGKLSKGLLSRQFNVPSIVTAKLDETCTIDPLTDKEKWHYVLINIDNDVAA